MEGREYRLLIVDDLEVNRQAALTGLGQPLDFATTYDEAISKVETQVYGGVITDLNFPRTDGGGIERLGFDLEGELKRYGLPSVILTAIEHNGYQPASILLDGIPVSLWSMRDSKKQLHIGTPKTEPEAWREALAVLQEIAPNMHEIANSHNRYRSHLGRAFRRNT